MRSLILIVAVFAFLSSASDHSLIKESVSPPRGWYIHSDPHPYTTLTLHVFLPQPNLHLLESALHDISSPDHPRFQQHLSKQDIDQLVAPLAESVLLVDEWFAEHGIEEESLRRSDAKDEVVLVNVPLSKVEDMLNTKYHVWKHSTTGHMLLRTTKYSLPSHLHAHIDLVQPSTSFSHMKPASVTTHGRLTPTTPHRPDGRKVRANSQQVNASCQNDITITCLRQLYNAVGIQASGTSGNRIGVTGYLNLWTNLTDYQTFLESETNATTPQPFEVVLVNGGTNDESQPNIEANDDTQYAFALSEPTPATFWSTGGMPPFTPSDFLSISDNEPYADWLSFILAQETIPQTISTSYADPEDTVPLSYAKRVCNGFAQITARGTTLLFASGDFGVGDLSEDPDSTTCFTNDGTNRLQFIPSFPASCPYVTSVGATMNIPEIGAFFTGGGFSNYFARPTFQELAVSTFLRKELPNGTYAGLFNPYGRGIPDVSFQGWNNVVVVLGALSFFDGTSASAPGFAGFVSLINDARLQKGLPPLGWLNPLIYRYPEAFNDITTGNNPGCGTLGFNATEGWDPITGLGTPDVRKLLAALVT